MTMMKVFAAFVAFLFATAAAAVVHPNSISHPMTQRSNAMCGDWDKVNVGAYTLENNLWGKYAASSGQQCTTLDGSSGSSIRWSSTWSWAGGENSPKAYPNVLVKVQQVQLSKIGSIRSNWAWTYSGNPLRADVAYDLFTSDAPGSAKKYEIMIWLADYAVNPIASSYNGGKATPLASGVAVEGHRWTLYQGSNEGATVLSFLPEDGKPINNFNGDLNAFIKYLVGQHKLPESQFLLSVGAGTEPFDGQNAKFTTSAYSAQVSYK